MTRVLLIIPTLDRSGAEKQLTLLACGLPRSDFDVRVVCLTRGGAYEADLKQCGIPVTKLRKRGKFDPVTWWQLRRLVRTWKPHVIHSWLFAANAYARMVGGGTKGPPVIVSERCVDSWKADWQHWLDRKLLPRTRLLVGNSRSVLDFYQRRGVPAEKLRLIPNGVPLPSPASELTIEERQPQRQSAWGLPPESFVIGFVGRLAEQKCLSDVLWALAMLAAYRPEVRLVLVGDGPERQRLQQLAQTLSINDRVVFAGHSEETSHIWPLFDVFVLASQFEGMSNSLMEALAHRVPAVVSDIPPNRELVQDDINGLVFPVGDRAGLAKRLESLIQNPDLALRLAEAGYQRMEQEFGVEQMVAGYAALYREVVGTAGSRPPLA